MREDNGHFKKGNKFAEKWTEEMAVNFGNEMINWLLSADENIFFEEFIFLIAPQLEEYSGISILASTPSYLSSKFETFSYLLGKARKIQELKLKKFGSFDKLNASIVKFLLSAEHGLTEKTEIESTNRHSIEAPQTLEDWYNENRKKK